MNDGENLLESKTHGSLFPKNVFSLQYFAFQQLCIESIYCCEIMRGSLAAGYRLSGQSLAVIFNGKVVKLPRNVG
jgi:hypothetical protein